MRPVEHYELRVRTEAEIEEILRRLRQGLEDLYGNRLRDLYLFGSYARGEADAESDVDVLIVLDRVEQEFDEIRYTSQLLSNVSLDADVSVYALFVSEEDWRNRNTPLLLNLRRDAVAA